MLKSENQKPKTENQKPDSGFTLIEIMVATTITMMIIGSVVFVKMSSPIRSKHPALSDTLRISGNQVSGQAATEIENLVINAVKKQ